MDEIRHRRWIAHHFNGKVKEFNYHLKSIIDACNESLRLFPAESERSTNSMPRVTYGFSSFANIVQTLKDSTSSILDKRIAWSDINKLRHGDFLFHCRNASTHDGHPIFNVWIYGRYYVISHIMRIDGNKKLVIIPAPEVDARTLCLEFAYDFSCYLQDALVPALNNSAYQGALYTYHELEEIFNNSKIPAFAQALFENSGKIISSALENMTNDPIAESRQSLGELAEYCEMMMKKRNLDYSF